MKREYKIKSFEELVDKRRRYVEVSKENNISLYNRLTRIYPDKAHFIFELLQNAEDMKASQVEFLLERDKLIFKHNGKKDFNLDDIVAITGIENNYDKQLNKTSIGKFGIGFKSVFAYTDTPEIHSGDMHFKIEDIFVPSKENVKNLKVIDENKVKWTIFIFPFNRKEKPPKKAYSEIKESLEELDYNSILFLQNIKRIDYYINKKSKGFVKLSENKTNNFISTETAKTKQDWLRFSELINFENENKIEKRLSIGVVFCLEYSEDTKSYTIISAPNRGKTFVYFPAINEFTGLRFHINGPFATTEARDSIVDCSKNKELMYELSKLIAKSLETIKELGLMNKSFFDVLPNDQDTWWYKNGLYKVILSKIKEAFKDNEYLPTLSGDYVCSSNALMGSKKFSDVINQDFLESVAGISKKWVVNASAKFLHSLDIEEFNSEKFFELFDYNQSIKLESYFSGIWSKYYNLEKSKYSIEEAITDDELDDETREKIESKSYNNTCNWFKEFYELTIKEYNGRNRYWDKRIIESFQRCRLILSETLNLLKPNNIFLQSSAEYADFIEDNNIEIVNLFVINDNNNENDIYKFFENELKIRSFEENDKIKWEIDNNKKIDFDEEKHFQDIIKYWSLSLANKIDLKNEAIFVSFDGEKHIYEKACNLVTSEILNKIYNKPLIWKGYKDKFTKFFLENINEDFINEFVKIAETSSKFNTFEIYVENILKDSKFQQEIKLKFIYESMFIKFLHESGIIDNLIIEEIKAEYNRLFETELDTKKTTHNGKGENIDYRIINIEMMFNNEYNKMLWDFLKEQKEEKYTKARYSPNKSFPVKECDSTLIYELKNNAWLPDKEGKLHKPSDITFEELSDDFKYDNKEKNELVNIEKHPLLKALEIGDKPEDKKDILINNLANYGFAAIPKEELNELEEFRRAKAKKIEEEEKEKQKKAEEEAKEKERLEKLNRKSINDIFADECKESAYNEDDIINIGDGSVNNIIRRTGKITTAFNSSEGLKPRIRKITIKDYMTTDEERTNLKIWYSGVCQICGWKELSSDGKPIFEGINMIRTSSLPEKARNADKLCWNSLCLCPNCAAEYKNCSLDISDVPRQVSEKEVNEKDSTKIGIEINLNNKKREIKYVPKHFLALKTVLNLLKKNE